MVPSETRKSSLDNLVYAFGILSALVLGAAGILLTIFPAFKNAGLWALAVGIISGLVSLVLKYKSVPVEAKLELVEFDSQPLPVSQQILIGPPARDFIGRDDEVAVIEPLVRAGKLVCVYGIPGVGKTELAKTIANDLRKDFRDGAIYLDFGGASSLRLTADQALRECLKTIDPNVAPHDSSTMPGLYHSLIATKSLLLVFDNVFDWAQVSELIPVAGSTALITSRGRVANATNIKLDVFTAAAAVSFLRSAVSNLTEDEAAEIAQLCGYLPLALRSAASQLQVSEDLTSSNYIEQLRAERTRLEVLGEEGVNLGPSAVLHLAYRDLSAEAGAVFRRLSVFRRDFGAETESSVCNDRQHTQLSVLVRRGLVMFDETRQHYRLHDLVRIFALTKAGVDEIRDHGQRLVNFMTEFLTAQNARFLATGEGQRQASAALARELGSIRDAWEFLLVEVRDRHSPLGACVEFLSAGGNLLVARLDRRELVEWCDEILDLHDTGLVLPVRQRIVTLWYKATALEKLGEYKCAEQIFREALDLVDSSGETELRAHLFGHLGRILSARGAGREAVEILNEAQNIFHNLGLHSQEAKVVAELGYAFGGLNDGHKAYATLSLRLREARNSKDSLDEARSLGDFANYFSKRNKKTAIICAETAADLFFKNEYFQDESLCIAQAGLLQAELGYSRGVEQIDFALHRLEEFGDKATIGLVLGQRGEALMSLDRPEDALIEFERQIRTALDIPDKNREASARGNKAIALNRLQRYEESVKCSVKAIKLANAAGNSRDEFIGHCHLAASQIKLGRDDEAVRTYLAQVDVGKRIASVDDVTHAFNHLAEFYEGRGDIPSAREYLQQAVDYARTQPTSHDSADTFVKYADFLARNSDPKAASRHLREALEIFEHLEDAACANRISGRLATLGQ